MLVTQHYKSCPSRCFWYQRRLRGFVLERAPRSEATSICHSPEPTRSEATSNYCLTSEEQSDEHLLLDQREAKRRTSIILPRFARSRIRSLSDEHLSFSLASLVRNSLVRSSLARVIKRCCYLHHYKSRLSRCFWYQRRLRKFVLSLASLTHLL